MLSHDVDDVTPLPPIWQVRARAALDLGDLSRMSARVDQLASDLATSARTAEPGVRSGGGGGLCLNGSSGGRGEGGESLEATEEGRGRGIDVVAMGAVGILFLQPIVDAPSLPPSPPPQVRGSYLTALKGLLLASGDRVSAPVLASVGDSLRDQIRTAGSASAQISGEDEEGDGFRVALAVCLGAHAGCAGAEQLALTMQVRGGDGGGRGKE